MNKIFGKIFNILNYNKKSISRTLKKKKTVKFTNRKISKSIYNA